MKCEKALKNMTSESISVKLKKIIDEHIGSCSYCHGQIAASEKVAMLLSKQEMVSTRSSGWSTLITGIREYRDKKQKNIFSWLSELLPLEPAARRLAVAGASFAVLIAVYVIAGNMQNNTSGLIANEVVDDTDFFIQEHALTQDSGLFGHGSFSQTFMGLSTQQNKFKYPNYKN